MLLIENLMVIFFFFCSQASVTLNIPKEHHKYLLGKSGQKLKDLEKATGCKISVPSINESSDVITITGSKEGIEKAVHEIKVTSDEQVRVIFFFAFNVLNFCSSFKVFFFFFLLV